MLDIGANMGQWMMPLSRKFPRSVIISFEPIPINFKFLCKASKILKLSNTRTFDFAISDKNGKEKMLIPYIDNVPVTTQSILKDSLKNKADDKFKGIEINAYTIDNFIEKLKINNVTLIKIDTEGAEDKVLSGGRNTILKFKPVMLLKQV
jgi:FkbM family methyltransferase